MATVSLETGSLGTVSLETGLYGITGNGITGYGITGNGTVRDHWKRDCTGSLETGLYWITGNWIDCITGNWQTTGSLETGKTTGSLETGRTASPLTASLVPLVRKTGLEFSKLSRRLDWNSANCRRDWTGNAAATGLDISMPPKLHCRHRDRH